jgi:pimeloyl-ACP methyl ester carboxylesterase/DNA-binding CsgD family transcriptional regulator
MGAEMQPRLVRFIPGLDGAQIAYAVSGEGPPVLLMPSWLTHLDHQWHSVAWRPWLEALSRRYTLIRFDPRGCGLSERSVEGLTFETWVRDAEALIDGLGQRQIPVIGICQGGAVALALAERRPDLIGRLVLYGTYARGRNRRDAPPMEPEKAQVMLEMLRLGWADEDGAFLRAFATQFQPDGGLDHLASWARLQRMATTGANAVVMTRVMFDIDVSSTLDRIGCPTLVIHPERDAVAPVEEGRLLARSIPGARFLPLDSANHFLRPDEPAWSVCLAALEDFLPRSGARQGAFAGLTPRECDVLEHLARGLDNAAIAGALGISEKTVRNQVSAIFAKLGSNSRAAVVVAARAAGFGSDAPHD